MESVNQVKQALSARSRTATLDELREEGRKKVRLIKAEHVAGMIEEAVHAAIQHSGMMPQEEVDKLVERSRQEFKGIVRDREDEAQKARDTEEELAQVKKELAALRSGGARSGAGAADGGASDPTAAAAAALAGGASPEVLLSLMNEMATLKASLMAKGGGGGGGGGDFNAAIEKLNASLNDRLEKIGKKVGISGAVETVDEIKLDGLFKHADKTLESNMNQVEVKQKAGGGIAANLARLKKLKGGG